MTKVLEAIHLDDPASLKRFLVFVASAGLVIATPFLAKLGLPTPSDGAIEAFVGLVAAFLLQSGAKSIANAKAAGDAAAAIITTTAQADAVIAAASKPPVAP